MQGKHGEEPESTSCDWKQRTPGPEAPPTCRAETKTLARTRHTSMCPDKDVCLHKFLQRERWCQNCAKNGVTKEITIKCIIHLLDFGRFKSRGSLNWFQFPFVETNLHQINASTAEIGSIWSTV